MVDPIPKKEVTVASYRTRRHQLVEEVPGLCIRRLTLEDPKTAREHPDSGLQLPARHVCHPRGSYVPSERPSYRSWLEQIGRQQQAVLTITSLELPDCPVPLIDSQANKRCTIANSRNHPKEETLSGIFSKLAEAKGRNIKHIESKRKSVDQSSEFIKKDYENGHCCQDTQSLAGSFSRAPTYADDDVDDDVNVETRDDVDDADEKTVEDELMVRSKDISMDCKCAQISEKLRISIRKKTEVANTSRSLSPEVTHTIRIAMKYHGRRGSTKPSVNKKTTSTSMISQCPGVSVALDFTLNCSSVQLTSRDVTVKPIGQDADSTKIYPNRSF